LRSISYQDVDREIIKTLAVCLSVAFYRCADGEDDTSHLPPSADYNTNVTVFIIWPGAYQFDVTGTTHVEINGNTFVSISDMNIGQSHIDDIEINGMIQNNEITFANEQFLVHIPVPGGDSLEEEVTLSMGPLDFTTDNLTGDDGRVVLRMTDDTVTKRGTFNYTLTKVK
jgi:hypothetical protein